MKKIRRMLLREKAEISIEFTILLAYIFGKKKSSKISNGVKVFHILVNFNE